jgi:hypothetical protein
MRTVAALTVFEEVLVLLWHEHVVVVAFEDILGFLERVLVRVAHQVLGQLPVQLVQLLILLPQVPHLALHVLYHTPLQSDRLELPLVLPLLRSVQALLECIGELELVLLW